MPWVCWLSWWWYFLSGRISATLYGRTVCFSGNGSPWNGKSAEAHAAAAEQGGKEGFGSRVIRFGVAREKDGAADIDYASDGLRCRIAFTKASEGPPVDVAAG